MEKQNEMDDPRLDTAGEIVDFIENHVGVSYNDLVTYAYDNDKHDWLEVFRSTNYRRMIAFCLRDKRKSDGVPYTNTLEESLKSRARAKKEYEKRHPLWFVGKFSDQKKE